MRKRPKLGQVFLHDANIIQKIGRVVGLKKTDHVVEIGCGDGILTQALSDQVDALTVIELDPVCIERSKNRVTNADAINWILADVLSVDFSQFQLPVRVVANIPYYLSAKLIQHFVHYKSCFEDITIMVQQEFAEKCVSGPGKKTYTSLSVYTQAHFEVTRLFDISKHSFYPVPKIDSTMIRLLPSTHYDGLDRALFESIVNAAFWGKRKQLLTALNKNPFTQFSIDLARVPFLMKYGKKRADQLSIPDYVALYTELKQLLS